MKKFTRKLRRLSSFNKFIIIYCNIIIIILLVFSLYVSSVLKEYDNNDVTNYITNIVYNMDEEDLLNYTEDENAKNNFDELINSGELNISKIYDLEDTYNVSVDNKKIFTVSLEKGDIVTKFGVLSHRELKTLKIESYLDRGIFYYDLYVQENYSVYVDGEIIDSVINKINYEKLSNVYDFVDAPLEYEYNLNNLSMDSKIKITDFFGNEVDYEIVDNTLVINKTLFSYEDVKKVLSVNEDILGFAENWSLFMSDDLSGSYHGFSIISADVLEDSYIYDKAYEWSRGVDITFTSSHTLKNPTFTNEKISDCQIYSETLFSCSVYLEKNMKINSTNIDKTDIFNQEIYYTKVNNNWKVVDMTTIIGE